MDKVKQQQINVNENAKEKLLSGFGIPISKMTTLELPYKDRVKLLRVGVW